MEQKPARLEVKLSGMLVGQYITSATFVVGGACCKRRRGVSKVAL